MRVLIQRVKWARVMVDAEVIGEIREGILLFLGIRREDSEKKCDYLVEKISKMRIFADREGQFSKSILELRKELLVVSQFTLYGNLKKGRRPDFSDAESSQNAKKLYNYFIKKCRDCGIKTEEGLFQAYMQVELCNDGPTTLIMDSL